MASLTPLERARMLKAAEAKFKAKGMPTPLAKRAAKEALRQFFEGVLEDEAKERKAANN